MLLGPFVHPVLESLGLKAGLDTFLRTKVVGFFQEGTAIGSGLLIAHDNSYVVLTVGHIGLASAIREKAGVTLMSQALPGSNLRLGSETRVVEIYDPGELSYRDAAVVWLDPRDAAAIAVWGGPAWRPEQGGPMFTHPQSAYLVTGFPNSLIELSVDPLRRRKSAALNRLDLWAGPNTSERSDGTVALNIGPFPTTVDLAPGVTKEATLPGMSGAPVWTGVLDQESKKVHVRLVGFHSGSNGDTAVFVPQAQQMELLRSHSRV
jgi:hypothetical protein